MWRSSRTAFNRRRNYVYSHIRFSGCLGWRQVELDPHTAARNRFAVVTRNMKKHPSIRIEGYKAVSLRFVVIKNSSKHFISILRPITPLNCASVAFTTFLFRARIPVEVVTRVDVGDCGKLSTSLVILTASADSRLRSGARAQSRSTRDRKLPTLIRD